jgi:hypothetical protein
MPGQHQPRRWHPVYPHRTESLLPWFQENGRHETGETGYNAGCSSFSPRNGDGLNHPGGDGFAFFSMAYLPIGSILVTPADVMQTCCDQKRFHVRIFSSPDFFTQPVYPERMFPIMTGTRRFKHLFRHGSYFFNRSRNLFFSYRGHLSFSVWGIRCRQQRRRSWINQIGSNCITRQRLLLSTDEICCQAAGRLISQVDVNF